MREASLANILYFLSLSKRYFYLYALNSNKIQGGQWFKSQLELSLFTFLPSYYLTFLTWSLPPFALYLHLLLVSRDD
jgi:hypothetical protein